MTDLSYLVFLEAWARFGVFMNGLWVEYFTVDMSVLVKGFDFWDFSTFMLSETDQSMLSALLLPGLGCVPYDYLVRNSIRYLQRSIFIFKCMNSSVIKRLLFKLRYLKKLLCKIYIFVISVCLIWSKISEVIVNMHYLNFFLFLETKLLFSFNKHVYWSISIT